MIERIPLNTTVQVLGIHNPVFITCFICTNYFVQKLIKYKQILSYGTKRFTHVMYADPSIRNKHTD